MSISVVVPAYNAETYLIQTLESIANQTYSDFECIIVDDGSTDSTRLLAQTWCDNDARFRCKTKTNQGLAAARNTGLSESNSKRPYFWPIDADDILMPGAFQLLIGALDSRYDAVGAYGIATYIDSLGHPIRQSEMESFQRNRKCISGDSVLLLPLSADTTFETLTYWNFVQVGGALLRKDIVEKAGGFDTSFRTCEDWDCFLRMSAFGPFVLQDTVILKYRRHENNMSNDSVKMTEGRNQVMAKASKWEVLSQDQRQCVQSRNRAMKFEEADTWAAWSQEALRTGNLIRFASSLKHAYSARAAARKIKG